MAQTQRRRALPRPTQNSNLGKSPTPSQKLIYIANKLGLPGIAGMQGSTVNIFDTVEVVSNATGRQTLSFFTNTQGKSRNYSNFQGGVLSAGEALVMEEVKFFILRTSSNNFSLDGNAIQQVGPFSATEVSLFSNIESMNLGLMNISIANSQVVKDYNINETYSDFNPRTTGVTPAQYTTGAANTPARQSRIHGNTTIYLESPPVLPPNQKLTVTLELPPTGVVASVTAIMCVVGKFGSIYSAKTTL